MIEDNEVKNFDKKNINFLICVLKYIRWNVYFFVVINIVIDIGLIIVIGVGVYFVIFGSIIVGIFVVFVGYLELLFGFLCCLVVLFIILM